mmetsp:Transcript_1341/g.3127  ORF Transcript_1341/g.3127 Transcript_1341/m.3127 type:complete len:299 (+) Transcript_1341:99-995(+)|eukprot:CAMPEP_0197577620 /NCGR_PEP_ID=MMETSP1326-20131121/2183_1 /TAXON_ID=1155430 /ORGANISM="Genus nov. species nov., Strain RCC2288" /LENGTH=298 /DNA_ID=CAMNT_0043140715 /DNA_START=99 /DNA_END=995 /DNA_ORIENTATION=+
MDGPSSPRRDGRGYGAAYGGFSGQMSSSGSFSQQHSPSGSTTKLPYNSSMRAKTFKRMLYNDNDFSSRDPDVRRRAETRSRDANEGRSRSPAKTFTMDRSTLRLTHTPTKMTLSDLNASLSFGRSPAMAAGSTLSRTTSLTGSLGGAGTSSPPPGLAAQMSMSSSGGSGMSSMSTMKRTSKGWLALPPTPLPLDQLPSIGSFSDWFREYGSASPGFTARHMAPPRNASVAAHNAHVMKTRCTSPPSRGWRVPSSLPAVGPGHHGAGMGWRQDLGGTIDGYEARYFHTLRKYDRNSNHD